MHPLERHPDSRPGPVSGIEADVAREPGGLRARFVLRGDLERLRIPPPRPPRMAPRLWEHTCCEIFVAPGGGPAYHEFNLSPSGEWAAHAFSRYREGDMLADAMLDPRIAVRRGPGLLELDALIALQGEKLLVALAAVVEADDGTLSYWALAHPPGRPDFHRRTGFAISL